MLLRRAELRVGGEAGLALADGVGDDPRFEAVLRIDPLLRNWQDAAAKMLLQSQRVIDRIVAKGVLHRNAGNRHKSRLAHAIKGLK